MEGIQSASVFIGAASGRRCQLAGFVYRRGDSWFGQFRVDTPELDEKGRFKRKTLTKFIAPAAGDGKVLKKRAMTLFYDEHLKDLHKSGPMAMFALRDFVRERFIPDVVWSCKPTGKAHYTYMLAMCCRRWAISRCGT